MRDPSAPYYGKSSHEPIQSEEELNKVIFEFHEFDRGNEYLTIYIANSLMEYLLNRIRNSNHAITIAERGEVQPDARRLILRFEKKILMERKRIIRKFVNELYEMDGLDPTDQQREFMVSQVAAAVERGMKVVATSTLPTHEELKEQGALYVDRPVDPETGRSQSIIKFLETGWPAPLIARGLLTRPDFRRIDPQAEQALRNWVRESKSQPPAHLYIPTKSEVIDRELSDDPEQIRTAWRLVRAHERRKGWTPDR